MLITLDIAVTPTDDRQARYLRDLPERAAKLLQVRPDQVHVHLAETDPQTRARNERWATIAQASWTGC
ncbi:hypothetical protein [Nonomuraea sp. KM90]|uniref:hypothetical protein n=1 Tax=Nonomuraea sp. KM90 TaxID=3457428 RepID=UPI003FCD3E8A